MNKIKAILGVINISFLFYLTASYIEIISKNLGSDPTYSAYNFFNIFL